MSSQGRYHCLSLFRLPFSIIWRDDLKDDAIKIPCSSILIALGATASGKSLDELIENRNSFI